MTLVLAGLQWNTCLIYLDNVIVFGKTFDEHQARLQQVFERLRSAGLKLKPSKCFLFCSSVAFLGHVICADGVLTDPEKVPPPRKPHMLAEIFTHAHSLDFKNRNSWAERG